jgi:hypothetical protein
MEPEAKRSKRKGILVDLGQTLKETKHDNKTRTETLRLGVLVSLQKSNVWRGLSSPGSDKLGPPSICHGFCWLGALGG